MSKYIVYIETLDPITWEIKRNVRPAGYVVTSGEADGLKVAREKFKLGNAQRAHLVADPVEVDKLIAKEKHVKAG